MVKVVEVVDENGVFTNPELEIVKNHKAISIFLAGPSPRKESDPDWRKDAIEILTKNISDYYATLDKRVDLLIFSPLNPKFENTQEYRLKQTLWETQALNLSDRIIFWIPRSQELPAFTTNIEIGQWMNDPKVSIGLPPEGIKNEYIKCRLKIYNKEYFEDLEDTLLDAVTKAMKQGK